ncbi:MAG TPA: DUF2306 domain-containing protein [Burkholderiaceae bacterium]
MTASTVSPLRAEPAPASPLPQTLRRWIWAAALVLMAVFVAHAAQRFLVFTEESYRNLWPNRVWLLPHFIGGAIALLAGAMQFWAGLRRRHPRVHRWVGRVYLAGVAIGAASAYVLSFRAVLGWPFGTAGFVMATAWTLFTVMAFVAIRRGQVAAHREWMLRSYVVAFGFVWFRVMVVSPLFVGLGSVPERLTVLLWLSWTVPLLLTEVALQWQRSVVPASLGTRLGQARTAVQT